MKEIGRLGVIQIAIVINKKPKYSIPSVKTPHRATLVRNERSFADISTWCLKYAKPGRTPHSFYILHPSYHIPPQNPLHTASRLFAHHSIPITHRAKGRT